MIGYITVGSNDLDKARGFYDQLMPVLGAGRIMEFGPNFTMYGTGMGKPGLAVCKPYDGNAATAGKSRSHPPERRLGLHASDRRHRRRKKQQVGSRADAYHQQPADRIAHRLSSISVIENPVEDRHAESIHIGEQRIPAPHGLPRSNRNGGYSSLIKETYTATR